MRSSDLESVLQKASRAITERFGLRLIFRGDKCSTDGRTIYLPSLPDPISDELIGAIRGWADHECAHHLFTDNAAGRAFKEKYGNRAFGILNALEDARVEQEMSDLYPGSAINFRAGMDYVRRAAEAKKPGKKLGVRRFGSALYTRAAGLPDEGWLPEAAYRLAEECDEELSALPDCRSTEEVAEVAARVWEKVKGRFTGEARRLEPEETEEDGDGEQEPESSETGPAPAGGDTEREEKHDREPGPSAGGKQDCGGVGPSSPMDLLPELIRAAVQKSHSGDVYRVWSTENDRVEVLPVEDGYDYREQLAEVEPYVTGLRRRLLRNLMGRRDSRWVGDRSRGRLDPRSLHRLVSGRSTRVFRQRTAAPGGPTACTLLLDISSSMRGEPMRLCRRLGLLFAETLEGIGFPTEILAFSTLDEDMMAEAAQQSGVSQDELSRRYSRFMPLYLGVLKGFTEPWREVAGRMGSLQVKHLTPLGEALLFAGRRLARRAERRKVLFCLTDGKPVAGCYDESVTTDHARRTAERLEAAGIETVGLGITEPCVEEIFPRHAVIRRLEDLPTGFMRELCRVLTGR
ncbi:MAG: cobaltochelatase CobT-related protein [Planctomycetota bacterium]